VADRGIRIPLVADVAQFLRGMTQAEGALTDVATDLDQLADRADTAATSVANDFDSAFRRVRDDARSAESAVDALSDEASDSARELGASFRGDPVEALEGLQELVANTAARIGGISGAIASIGTGIAFGALTTFYDKWQQRQEEIRQQVVEIRDELLETFTAIDADVLQRNLFKTLDAAGVSIADLRKDLIEVGEYGAFQKALQVGDEQALADILTRVEGIQSKSVGRGALNLIADREAAIDIRDALAELPGILRRSQEEAAAVRDVLNTSVGSAYGIPLTFGGGSVIP
jgi:hypothetical protein